MSEPVWAGLARQSGFRPDPRFGGAPAAFIDARPVDALEQARAEGYAAGRAEAEALAAAELQAALAARSAIELAFARLSAEHEEELRTRLHGTVEELCRGVLAPALADPAILSSRIARAAAMLARADDERVLRLHPADLDLLNGDLPPELAVSPDSALARGTVRIETSQGGVEDGPDQWRQQLAEALAQC